MNATRICACKLNLHKIIAKGGAKAVKSVEKQSCKISFSVNEDRGIFVTYRKSGLRNVLIILPLNIIRDVEMEYKLAL